MHKISAYRQLYSFVLAQKDNSKHLIMAHEKQALKPHVSTVTHLRFFLPLSIGYSERRVADTDISCDCMR